MRAGVCYDIETALALRRAFGFFGDARAYVLLQADGGEERMLWAAQVPLFISSSTSPASRSI